MNRFLLFTLLVACSATLTAQTLVAHYPFDGNANDISPFNNHAMVGGATLTAGYDGTANGAYFFDGMRDSIVAPPAAHLNTPQATWAMWVRVDSLVQNGEYYIFSHGGYQDRVKMSLPNHGYPVLTTNTTVRGIKDGDANPEALVPGIWTHLTFVHDNDTNYIYFNGELAKKEQAEGALQPTNRVLGVGYDAAFTGSYFFGAIDDIRVYDDGMSPAQVRNLFASFNDPVSTRDLAFAELGRVYPNPAAQSFVFEHNLPIGENPTYQLFDAMGREVARRQINQVTEWVDVSAFPSGMYTFRVTTATGQSSTRLIIE